jgi:CxC4 like cysteine cluster associated with KDZ transposases
MCTQTSKRIGPDLGEYSVFNYNNEWGFTHELINGFSCRMTSQSEVTFVGFHRSIVNAYVDNQSPIKFCTLMIFERAWLGFICKVPGFG